MNDSISLTIPRIAGDLRCAAHYLNTLAEGLDSQPATPDSPATVSNSEEIAKAAEQAIETTQAPEPPAPPAPTASEPNPATAFGGSGDAAPEPPAPPAPTTEAPEQPTTTAPAGVDVDSDGLPWDERIHAGSRKKLAKTQQWKKKRGVSDEVIAQVEAELRQVMAIPAEQPAAPQPPVATEAPAPPPAAAPATAQPVTDFTGWGWQEFMAEFMKRAMNHDQATEACKAHGIDSTAVLATRPDLIPQVAATLFGG